MNEEIAKYFEEDQKDNCLRFMGEKLECFIPERYEGVNMLTKSEHVHACGIFSLRINGKLYGGVQIPAIIEIEYSETYNDTIDNDKFYVVVLHKGDKLLCSLDVIQMKGMGYFMWNEFLSLGNLPKYTTYGEIWNLFDDLSELTGNGLHGNHSLVEIILAHLYRDRHDLNIKYRHTNMKEPPATISLRNIAYGPTSTSSRIAGSYSEDGLNSALLNQSDENHELEDIFRS